MPLVEKQREQAENTQINPRNQNSGANSSSPNNNVNNNKNNNINKHKNSDRAGRIRKLFTHPERDLEIQATLRRYATLEPMQPIERHPGRDGLKDGIRSKKEPIKLTRMKLIVLQPKI